MFQNIKSHKKYLLPCYYEIMLQLNHLLYFKTCGTHVLHSFVDFPIKLLEFLLEVLLDHSALGLEGWGQISVFNRKQFLV